MRAHQFIAEAPITPYETEPSSIGQAVATIKEHCSQAIPMLVNNTPLWRGMNNHPERILQIWPETGERASQNTSNHYTQLLSNSPYMRGFPQRNKSVICSTSHTTASSYGAIGFGSGAWLYAIIPYDNVEIAVCPTNDLWDIEVTIPEIDLYQKSMRIMNDTLAEFGLSENFKFMQAQLNNPRSTPYKNLNKHFQAHYMKITPEQLIPAIFKALQPKNLGFKLLSVQEFAANPPVMKECWVGGPCVAIHRDYFADIRVQFMPGATQ